MSEDFMPDTTAERLAFRALVFKAMGHPSRLAIIEELGQGERCAGDLHKRVGGDLSTVSKHLSVLRNAGLVSADKRGNQVFYTLRCPCIMTFFDCVEGVINGAASGTPLIQLGD